MGIPGPKRESPEPQQKVSCPPGGQRREFSFASHHGLSCEAVVSKLEGVTWPLSAISSQDRMAGQPAGISIGVTERVGRRVKGSVTAKGGGRGERAAFLSAAPVGAERPGAPRL